METMLLMQNSFCNDNCPLILKFPNMNKKTIFNKFYVPFEFYSRSLNEINVIFIGECPGCFLKGTPILTDKGAYNIENKIIIDNYFINNIESYVIDYPIIKFKVNKFPEYICTNNHKILVRKRNNYLNTKLPKGLDHVWYTPIEDIQLTDKEQYFVCVKKINHFGQEINLNIKQYKKYGCRINDKKIPDYIKLDNELAFLFGVYMGDGYSNFKNGIINICISKGFKEQFLNRIINALSKFNLKPTISNIDKKIYISIYSRSLVNFFINSFGKNCYTKRIPKIFFNTKKNIISQFLFGWYITDGSHKKNLYQQITPVSKLAIWDGVIVGLKYRVLLGVRNKLNVRKNEVPCYDLTINLRSIKNLNWPIKIKEKHNPTYGEDNEYFYLKINSIKKNNYTGFIYDKTTKTNCYHIPFVVHNSEEAKYKRPFYPKATSGRILRKIIEDLKIENYAIANIVSCRPTNLINNKYKNRTPTEIECDYCISNLRHFMWFLNDNIKIILLGKTAAFSVLKNGTTIKNYIKNNTTITSLVKLSPLEYYGKIFAANFHPRYISSNGGIGSEKYKDYLIRMKLIIDY